MTFGRMRTVHLTAVLYGWITNAELAIIIWLMPLLRRPLIGNMWIMMGGALVSVAIASGIGAIGAGWTDGLEYLEMPWRDRHLLCRRHGLHHRPGDVYAGQPQVESL